ncbi:MAG: hypothetical protein D3919_15875 [Candidatus Electrothrix sp. AW5]|nr:hypothetical protein [Candidatus Electrothrix gigas]
MHTGFKGLKVSERVPMPDDPKRSVPYKTLLTYREKGLQQYIPDDSEQVYSVQELLGAVHPDNEQEGERMRVAVQADKREGRLRRAVKALNKYGEWKPNVMGVGFNFNAWFDELLNKEGK